MVNSKEALESRYLTPDLVRDSKTKMCVIIDGGTYEQTDFGRKLTMTVQIDSKTKTWRPNKDSVANLQVFGIDTDSWVGKRVKLNTGTVNGKPTVYGFPHPDDIVKNGGEEIL